jgi:hypothetical protein
MRDELREIGRRFEGRLRRDERARRRRECLDRRTQQFTRAAPENDVLRLDAVLLGQHLDEVVFRLDWIAVRVAQVARDDVEDMLSGTIRILITINANHPGPRRQQAVGAPVGNPLKGVERFVTTPIDQWSGDEARAPGAERGEK